MGAQIGAARLLYGMGRSNALPKSFFGVVDEKHRIPRNNVILIGAIVLIGAFFLTFEQGIGLLNFGALIAFMGVNAAAFMRYFVHSAKEIFSRSIGGIVQAVLVSLLVPLIGFVVCGLLWWNLSRRALILGTVWMTMGVAFGIWKTKWFREPLSFEMPAE
jgi:amino acid transporter